MSDALHSDTEWAHRPTGFDEPGIPPAARVEPAPNLFFSETIQSDSQLTVHKLCVNPEDEVRGRLRSQRRYDTTRAHGRDIAALRGPALFRPSPHRWPVLEQPHSSGHHPGTAHRSGVLAAVPAHVRSRRFFRRRELRVQRAGI